jgi:hypothetical protein
MKFTITEMSVGEILERGIKLLFARLPAFFAIELIVLSPTLIMQLALPDVAISPFGQTLVVLPMLILGPIGSAALLRVITQEYLEQPIGLGEAFTFALGRFLPLLGTSIIAGFGIVFGLMFCCIPGIYLHIVWAMMSQVVVMENIAGPSALSRSKSLVEGYFWHVFGVLFLLGFCIGAVNFVIVTGITLALPFQGVGPNPFMPVGPVTNYVNYAIVHLVSTLVNTLGQTFTAICTTLLYFDLRNRKEAFNIEHLIGWSDQYRTWRDEPDPSFPVSGSPAPPETGIKPGAAAPPPETGIKDPGADAARPRGEPPPS